MGYCLPVRVVYQVYCLPVHVHLYQVLVCESGEWKMMTVDESKPRGRAPPFCQRLLKMAPFHIVIQLIVLLNAIVAASMHFDHRTPTLARNDPYTWYYYAEVSGTMSPHQIVSDSSSVDGD